MKPKLFRSWALAAVCVVPASATTFSAFYNNGTGQNGDHHASVYAWQAAIGTSALIDDSLATGDGYVTGVSQGTTNVEAGDAGSTSSGFLFSVPAGSQQPGVLLLHTTDLTTSDVLQNPPAGNPGLGNVDWYRNFPESLAGLTVGDISGLSVFTSAPDTSILTMRFAVQVDGVWYASDFSFQQATANTYIQQTIDPGTGNWRADVFSTGVLDDDLSDNALGPLPAVGMVQGYGLYADTGSLSGSNARVRIDAFQVKTPDLVTPEITGFTPSGAGMWEVTVTGGTETTYKLIEDATLSFTPGTDVVFSSGDVLDGTFISSTEFQTTVAGTATVRISLAGTINFVRVETF